MKGRLQPLASSKKDTARPRNSGISRKPYSSLVRKQERTQALLPLCFGLGSPDISGDGRERFPDGQSMTSDFGGLMGSSQFPTTAGGRLTTAWDAFTPKDSPATSVLVYPPCFSSCVSSFTSLIVIGRSRAPHTQRLATKALRTSRAPRHEYSSMRNCTTGANTKVPMPLPDIAMPYARAFLLRK